MPGGHFDYKQYGIGEIADSIARELRRQGKQIPAEDLWYGRDYYEKYPEERLHTTYPKEIQDKFKEAIRALRIAAVYAQRVDWFLSCNDTGDDFLKRLADELGEIPDNLDEILSTNDE